MTDTVQFIDVKPAHIDGDEYTDPTPQRTFDLRTSEERLVMWCASLERRLEEQATRITHLELCEHRRLNAGEVEA